MLRAAPGEEAFAVALNWAVASSRWRVADVRSMLAAGTLVVKLPRAPVRSAHWLTTPWAGCHDRRAAAGSALNAGHVRGHVKPGR